MSAVFRSSELAISVLLGSTELYSGAVQYRILRQKGTEPAGSGIYNKHKVLYLSF